MATRAIIDAAFLRQQKQQQQLNTTVQMAFGHQRGKMVSFSLIDALSLLLAHSVSDSINDAATSATAATGISIQFLINDTAQMDSQCVCVLYQNSRKQRGADQ